MTEVLGTKKNATEFDGVLKIIISPEESIYGLYNKDQMFTIKDILKAMYKNLKYVSSLEYFYEKASFIVNGKIYYDRDIYIKDMLDENVSEISLYYDEGPTKREREEVKKIPIGVKIEGDSFPIHFKTLTGEIYTIKVSQQTKIEDVKLLYQKETGVRADIQRIIFSGKQLEDGRSVKDYNIEQDSTLYSILRLRGGMMHQYSGRNGKYTPLNNIMFSLAIEDNNDNDDYPDFE